MLQLGVRITFKKNYSSILTFLLLTYPSLAKSDWQHELLLKGDFIFQNFIETYEPIREINNSYSLIELRPYMSLKNSRHFKFVFEPYYYNKIESRTTIEKNFFDPQQLYIETQISNWRLRAGNQTYNWGVFDIYSPGDITNTTTFFDPLNTIKIGATSLDLTWSQLGRVFQILYMPKRSGSRFPEENSRWLPREIIINPGGIDADILLPDNLNYSYQRPIEIEDALKHNWGSRFSLNFNEVDWQIFYFEGVSPRPHLDVEITVDTTIIDPSTNKVLGLLVQPDVTLIPSFFKQQTIGNSLVWAPEWGILRFETVYSKVQLTHEFIDRNLFQTALGIEKTWAWSSYSLLTQVQYYKSHQESRVTNTTGNNYRLFDNTLICNLLLTINDRSSFFLSEIYDTDNQSFITVLGTRYKWHDNIGIELKGLSINGPTNSIAGTYKNNDLIEARLSVYY